MRGAALLLLLSGCSVLFDPDKVPLKCTGLPPAPSGPLEATAGAGDTLAFDWPLDVGLDGGYELCFGPDSTAKAGCHDYGTDVCDGGHCVVVLQADAGLAYNVRTYAQLFERDNCKHTSDPGLAPSVSATPLNGSFQDSAGMVVEAACDAGFDADGGTLIITGQAPGLSTCIASAGLGDDAWADATLDVEIRLFGNTAAGVAFHYPSGSTTTPRLAAILTSAPTSSETLALTRRDSSTSNIDVPVATGIAQVNEGVWYALRVSIKGAWVSVALAPLGMPPVEVLRWQDIRPSNPGRLGVAMASVLGQPVDAELRNLRVRTGAEIPDGGATQASWNFVGAGALDGTRVVAGTVTNVRTGACPAYDAGCADCLPESGSACLELTESGLSVGSASFGMPLGIDPSAPWSMHFKFAAAAGDGANAPQILRTTVGDFGAVSILSAQGVDWLQDLQGFGTGLGQKLVRGEWNRFDVAFDGAGKYTVTWNGVAAATGQPIPSPPPLDPHLGAMLLGGSGFLGAMHGYYSDVSLSQP